MKKYKLLKDLPLYPAGTICEIRKQDNSLYVDGSESVVKVGDDSFVEIITCLELQSIREGGKFDEWFEEIDENKVWKPKECEEYWYTYGNGDIESDMFPDESDNKYSQSMAKSRVEIGNCFKTEEDAEKAVEKLKALRRLREAGLKFDGYEWNDNNALEIYAKLPWIDQVCSEYDQISDDLHLLFGKEDA